MAHDAYFCAMPEFQTASVKPFPTKRKDELFNFIGCQVGREERITFEKEHECPVECRPTNHKDWLYC